MHAVGRVAQLVRARGSHPRGHRFESYRAHLTRTKLGRTSGRSAPTSSEAQRGSKRDWRCASAANVAPRTSRTRARRSFAPTSAPSVRHTRSRWITLVQVSWRAAPAGVSGLRSYSLKSAPWGLSPARVGRSQPRAAYPETRVRTISKARATSTSMATLTRPSP